MIVSFNKIIVMAIVKETIESTKGTLGLWFNYEVNQDLLFLIEFFSVHLSIQQKASWPLDFKLMTAGVAMGQLWA